MEELFASVKFSSRADWGAHKDDNPKFGEVYDILN